MASDGMVREPVTLSYSHHAIGLSYAESYDLCALLYADSFTSTVSGVSNSTAALYRMSRSSPIGAMCWGGGAS